MEKVYHETQKFRHWLLWLVLFLMLVGAFYSIYQQMLLNIPFGQNPTSDTGLIIIAIFVVALNFMFWFIRLKTKIDDNGIEFSFYLFVKRKYAWSEIEKAAIR